jgi:hypothetical protein
MPIDDRSPTQRNSQHVWVVRLSRKHERLIAARYGLVQITKDQQIKRQMGQWYSLSKIRS